MADRPNRRVQVFTLDGKYLTQVFINRAGPSPASAAGLALLAGRSSSSSCTSPTTATRTCSCSIAAAGRCSTSSDTAAPSPATSRACTHLASIPKATSTPAKCCRATGRSVSLQRPVVHAAAERAAGAGAGRDGRRSRRNSQSPWPTRTGCSRTGRISATSSRARRSASFPTARAASGCITDRSRRSCTSTPTGNIVKTFGDGMFVQAHGFCQDRDGNFWAGDSGPFTDTPEHGGTRLPGVQVQPRRQSAADARQGRRVEGRPRYVHRTDRLRDRAERRHPHRRRPLAAADQRAAGRRSAGVVHDATASSSRSSASTGAKPGEFMGPHGLAFDSQGRLFVADRSNNRIQIFDKRHERSSTSGGTSAGRAASGFSRTTRSSCPTRSRTSAIGGPPHAPEGGGNAIRNPGWKNGIRIGSAKDGSLRYFIEGTRPEGHGGRRAGQHLRRADRRLRREPVRRLPAEVREAVESRA